MSQSKDPGKHLDLTEQEQIVEHPRKDGAVAGTVTEVAPGTETQSARLSRRDLIKAIQTDLKDSYDSVFFQCDGDMLALTDHEAPTETADVGHLSDVHDSVDLRRAEAFHTGDETAVALIQRDYATDALAELDADRVTVHVETARPVVVEDGGEGVAIAPCVKPTVARGGDPS